MKFIFSILIVCIFSFSDEAFSDVYRYTKILSDKNLFSLNVADGEVNISDVTMK